MENKLYHRERIEKGVSDYLDKNKEMIPLDIYNNIEKRKGVINIGVSILCTNWEVSYKGGSFVQSIVNNDLMGAVSRADIINFKCLKFYATMLNNIEYIH